MQCWPYLRVIFTLFLAAQRNQRDESMLQWSLPILTVSSLGPTQGGIPETGTAETGLCSAII